MRIDKKYWDGTRWHGHLAFNTVNHLHVSDYSGGESCDIMVVECEAGRWYVEDNWGGDANGAEGVWNPFDPSDAEPRFFDSEDAAIRHAVSVVASVTGTSESTLLKIYLED